MLTHPAEENASPTSRRARWVAAGLSAALFGVLAATVGGAVWEPLADNPHDTASLAEILFSRYVLPFEVAGLTLTIALIGSIVLAREEPDEEDAR
jgi:NADH-quinone oxidoreductase subunit J